jgi:enoyl-CoA hydratase/carnithine racemase
VPTIALGDADTPLAGACDLAVSTIEAASKLAGRIEAFPMASLVLVQALRATECLPIPAALAVESMAYATLQDGPEFRRWREAHRREATHLPADPGPPVLIGRDGGRMTICLNRPSRFNAIDVEMRDALVEAFDLVSADRSIHVATVSGLGRCFSTGGDLVEFGTAPDPATAHMIRSQRLPAASLAPGADRFHFRLHGACIGAGIELPAFAACVTARRDAFFQLPELGFGLIPGAGGTVSLPRRIGRQRTAYLVLSGRRISAATALEWGLIDGIED